MQRSSSASKAGDKARAINDDLRLRKSSPLAFYGTARSMPEIRLQHRVDIGNCPDNLLAAEKNGLVVQVQRLADVRTKLLPQLATAATCLQEEVVGSVSQDALQPRFPAGRHFRNVMAIFD